MEYTPLIDDEPKILKEIRFSNYRATHAVFICIFVLSLPWVIYRFGGGAVPNETSINKTPILSLSENDVSSTSDLDGIWKYQKEGPCLVEETNGAYLNTNDDDNILKKNCKGIKKQNVICVDSANLQIQENFCYVSTKPEPLLKDCTIECPPNRRHHMRI